MNTSKRVRIIVDILMVLVLLLLMSNALIGEVTHEVLGISMFLLFAVHQFLNQRFYTNLTKGRYSVLRGMMAAIDLTMLAVMLFQVLAGIILSKHLFTFLPVPLNTNTYRLIHLSAPYWLFCLSSLHLGFHSAVFKKIQPEILRKNRKARILLTTVIACYGAYAFVKRRFPLYMFLIDQYAFFDFDEPLIRFFLDHIAVMLLFAILGSWLMKILPRLSGKRRRINA